MVVIEKLMILKLNQWLLISFADKVLHTLSELRALSANVLITTSVKRESEVPGGTLSEMTEPNVDAIPRGTDQGLNYWL